MFWGPRNHFWSKYGLKDFKFLFLGELGTCLQSLIFTRLMETSKNRHFAQRGYAEIYRQRLFFDNKKVYEKFLY
jgi:hypothetical protein